MTNEQVSAERRAMAEASQRWLQKRLAELQVIVAPARTVEENLALDEEFTARAAADNLSLVRLWWGGPPTVVTGNSEAAEVVADLAACERLGVRVLRRRSGGGTVLQTADVLNYSLTAPTAPLLDVRVVFELGARILIAALANFGLKAEMRGTSDVVIGPRKISGNAQARRQGGVLLHGTLLRDIDLDLVEACLRHPPREPAYRQGRGHRDFLTTLVAEGVTAAHREVEAAIASAALDLSSTTE